MTRTPYPERVCRFSGCREPYARTVVFHGASFRLCDKHARRLEAVRP